MRPIFCKVPDAASAQHAVLLMQTAMVPDFKVIGRTAHLETDLPLQERGNHLFPASQTQAYRQSMQTLIPTGCSLLHLQSTYMASAKEVNDLRCACADIAQRLLAGAAKDASVVTRLRIAQRYFRNHFRYEANGDTADHCAVDMLRTGHGVCQAIASMATVLLPHMGVPCLYIKGDGFSGRSWEPHAWNAVRLEDGRWAFVDFTFGLNGIFDPPSTVTALAAQRFETSHHWDAAEHAQERLEESWAMLEELTGLTIYLPLKEKELYVGEVRLEQKDSRAFLTGSETDGFCIRLKELYRIMGGGVEYVAAEDVLHFCLLDTRRSVGGASRYMRDDGAFDVSILRALKLNWEVAQSGLLLALR